MLIKPFAAGSYVSDRTTSNLIGLKSRLDTLTAQLASGRAADTYGGLGAARTTSLDVHAAISAITGYATAIDGATTRASVLTNSLTQIRTLGTNQRLGLLNSLQSTTPGGVGNSVILARAGLDAAVDALNQQVAGQYIFAGRLSDRQPVVSTDLMLDGDPVAGLSGLKDLIREQTAADLGSDGLGRLLPPTQSGSTVTLAENPDAETRANFGFSLADATGSNPSGISATLTAATSPTVGLTFATQPADGDRVRVAVLQSDGSQKILDLTARTNVAPGSDDSFTIGATAADTAANLKTLLGTADIASVQSANPPQIGATFAGGSAGSVALSVGTPSVGDSITLKLRMRDGTEQSITLTARGSADPASASDFAIGATPAATAANLSTALTNALKEASGTALAGSASARAAQNFFDGSTTPGLAPRRVSGGGYAQTASAATVIWYEGDDASADPRRTANVQIGANRSVAIGAQANEAPLKETLAGLAVLAADTFSDGAGGIDTGRFQATAQRAATALEATDADGGVARMIGEVAASSSSMASAKTQNQTAKDALQDSLDGVETVSTEEVAAKLLTLQTQLQASYQVTSMLSKLSLVNYLG